MGIIGLFTDGSASVIALVTGIVEAFRIKSGRSSRRGYWMNLAGLLLAVFKVVLFVIAIAFVYDVLQLTLKVLNSQPKN